MAIVNLTPPYQQFYDANGDPLSGGLIYTYTAGTLTPLATYTDQGGGTPNANPVVLDSAGRADIWVSNAVSYKFIVKTSTGTTVKTVDNVTPFSAGLGLAGLGAQAASTIIGNATTSSAVPTALSKASVIALLGIPAGGFVNKFRNPGFDIAGRGTTSTTTSATGVYSLDGWIVGSDGTRTLTWTQVFGSIASNNVNYLQLQGAASTTATFVKQRIESYVCSDLSGKVCTFQIYISNTAGASMTPTLTIKVPTAQDNWAATTTTVNAVSLQTLENGSSSTVSYTFTADNNTKYGLEVQVDFGSSMGSGSSIYLGFADIRATPGVTVGLNSSPPSPEIRPISIEQLYNLRYLPSFGTLAGPIATGAATSTSASGYFIPFRVPTRIKVTGLTVKTVGHFEIADFANSDVAATTGLTFAQASPNGVLVTATVSGTPLTSATSYMLYAKTALAGNLIFTGAEL